MKLAGRLFALVGSVPVSVLVACSSDDEVVGASGLARDRTVASLSAEEATKLCDWSLAVQGGAGEVTDCGGGVSSVVHTKEECVEDIAVMKRLGSCYAVTVAEVEDCSSEEGNDGCASSSTCKTIEDRLEACAAAE